MKNRWKIGLTWLAVALGTASCRPVATAATATESDSTAYAAGFTVRHADSCTLVDIVDPWDTTRLLQRYVLVDRSAPLPDSLPEGTLVRVPLQRVVVYSAVHCGMLEELGVADRIAGVCESRYIDLSFVREGIERGTIADLGEASSPDLERMIALSPDALLVSPFENTGYGRVEKSGIPLLELADYMEAEPMGRVEWIRLLGLFFGRETEAEKLFRATESAYDSLRALAENVSERPTVISERKYGAVWYVAGGRSYMARLFRGAGADYLWADDPSAGSIPLSFEEVFEKGGAADYWLIKYNSAEPLTYDGLRRDYEPYRRFAAFENGRVYACHLGQSSYFEETPIHPDRLLRDLIGVFHPELLPGYELRYFKPLEP